MAPPLGVVVDMAFLAAEEEDMAFQPGEKEASQLVSVVVAPQLVEKVVVVAPQLVEKVVLLLEGWGHKAAALLLEGWGRKAVALLLEGWGHKAAASQLEVWARRVV